MKYNRCISVFIELMKLLSAIFLGAVVGIYEHGAIFTEFLTVGFVNFVFSDFNAAFFTFCHNKYLR